MRSNSRGYPGDRHWFHSWGQVTTERLIAVTKKMMNDEMSRIVKGDEVNKNYASSSVTTFGPSSTPVRR